MTDRETAGSPWPQVHVTEVDGVPAVWADVPGPLRAGLWVRVGHADETLPTSGITHLLEHLALFGLARPGDHSNGQVDATASLFHCVGDPTSVVDFLGSVSRQLADPPTARLEEERGILAAENAARGGSAEATMLSWRYGAGGYGLPAQAELGLRRVAADDVRAWSARFATRGNVALWFSGPPPAGLRLHLPDGPAVPAPDPRRGVLPELPASFQSTDSTCLSLHAVLDRGYANSALAQVIRQRLVDVLRVESAVAYSPNADYRALTHDAGRLLVVTDLVDGRQTDGTRLALDVVHRLAGERPVTDDEVEAWRAGIDRDASEPGAALGFVVSQAWGYALHGIVETVEEAAAARAALTADQVTAAAGAALSTAVAMVPRRVRLVREGWTPIPDCIAQAVEGDALVHQEAPARRDQLVLAGAGVSLRDGDAHLTVRVEDVAGVLAWKDGRRDLVSAEAIRLTVEPTMWQVGWRAVEHIDRVFPPHVRIDMGERPAHEVPRPAAPTVAPGESPQKGPSIRFTAGLVVLVLFALASVVRLFTGGPGAAVAIWVPSAIWAGVVYRRQWLQARAATG